MKRLLTYLGLLATLLAMPYHAKAETWAYYLYGDINSWDINDRSYMFGQTSNSSDQPSWTKTFTGAQLDPNKAGTAYFKIIRVTDGTQDMQLGPDNTNDVELTINGGETGLTSNNAKSFYITGVSQTAEYTIKYVSSSRSGGTISVTGPAPEITTIQLKGGFDDWKGTTYDEYNSQTGVYSWTFTTTEFPSAINFKLYNTSGSAWLSSGSAITEDWSSSFNSNSNDMSYTYDNTDVYSVTIEAMKVTDGWKMRAVLTYDPHDYYWVSPQVTNGQKLPYFKMVASRNRSGKYGDGKISTKYFTFTMKDDDFHYYNGNPISKETTIQWYIVRDDNKVFYRPATALAYDDTPASYSGAAGSGDLDSYVKYKNYWNGSSYAGADAYKTTDATRAGSFAFRKGDHKSVTFNMNADKGHIFFNYVDKGLANPSTNSEFYLIGNFKAASETESISISDTSHKLTRLYYTGDEGSDTYSESCDSVVYVCTVYKPTTGDKSWGNLYLDVNPSGNENWGSVYRPLISLYNGLDGRALVGGLTTAGQGGDNNKGDQSLNPETSDKYTSYEFRFNATTMTYRITFHTSLYLVGPGVSATGGTGSWDLSKVKASDPSEAFDPRIRLKATQEKDHYRNLVYFTNGGQFRFIKNTDESATPNYAYTWYENDYKPKWTHVTTTNEEDYYPGNETQFRNNMVYENGTGSTDSDKPKDAETNSMTFDLPTGWYYVNFYPNAATPYYTIEHSMELRDFKEVYYGTKGTGEVRNVNGRNDYKFLRVWSDHIAWNKPDNIDVFVVSAFDHNANTTTATLKKLNIDYIPAKTGVILGCKLSKDNLTSGLVYDNAATLAWDKGEYVNYYNTLTAELTPYSAASTSYSGESKLIPLYEETELKRFSDETGIKTGDGYANYLFGFYRCKKYQKNYTGNNNDFDLGFWLTTGEGKTYANSAFLHLTKAQAEDLGVGTAYDNIESASAPAFMLLFDESDDNVITGISDITTAKGNSVAPQGWYTLQGVRTAKPTQRGIYIYNGKKVIVND